MSCGGGVGDLDEQRREGGERDGGDGDDGAPVQEVIDAGVIANALRALRA